MCAYHTLNPHATACMQHMRHAEHSPKACSVQKRDEHAPTPTPQPHPPFRECTARRWLGGGVRLVVSDANGGPHEPARESRNGGVRGGGTKGNGGSTEEVGAGEGVGGQRRERGRHSVGMALAEVDLGRDGGEGRGGRGWGGGGGGEAGGTQGLCPRTHRQSCMLGTSSKAIGRHRRLCRYTGRCQWLCWLCSEAVRVGEQ